MIPSLTARRSAVNPTAMSTSRSGRWAATAALGLLLATSTPVSAQRVALDQLDRYVARAVRDWHVPGLAIAVVKDDSVVFSKGYGLRELGKPGAVDAGTRFAIGSTTKAMTAVALAMLVDE